MWKNFYERKLIISRNVLVENITKKVGVDDTGSFIDQDASMNNMPTFRFWSDEVQIQKVVENIDNRLVA